MTQRSIVGDAINFRGTIYGPVNELGVVALFAKVCEELGFIVEEIRAEYPDCVARQQMKRGWERIAIEFEYRSSNFERHGHDPERCDLIVCWVHDWERTPIPVLSLRDYVAQQKSTPRARRTGPTSRCRSHRAKLDGLPAESRTATSTSNRWTTFGRRNVAAATSIVRCST
jgi:hypothetical protein